MTKRDGSSSGGTKFVQEREESEAVTVRVCVQVQEVHIYHSEEQEEMDRDLFNLIQSSCPVKSGRHLSSSNIERKHED